MSYIELNAYEATEVETLNKRSVSQLINSALKIVKESVERNMDAKKRNASYATVGSLHIERYSPTSGILKSEATPFEVLERGRGGGHVPYGFVDIIRRWIEVKGIAVRPMPFKPTKHGKMRSHKRTEAERGLHYAAGAIAHTIATKGTRLHRMGRMDDIYTTAMNQAVQWLGDRIERTVDLTAREAFNAFDQGEWKYFQSYK